MNITYFPHLLLTNIPGNGSNSSSSPSNNSNRCSSKCERILPPDERVCAAAVCGKVSEGSGACPLFDFILFLFSGLSAGFLSGLKNPQPHTYPVPRDCCFAPSTSKETRGGVGKGKIEQTSRPCLFDSKSVFTLSWAFSGWFSSLARRRPLRSPLAGASSFARRPWSQQRRACR